MAHYTYKGVAEAEQFKLTDAEKKEIEKSLKVFTLNGLVEAKKRGENEYFGLVSLNGNSTVIDEGDYVFLENGKAVKTLSKVEFEENYTKTAKKTA